MNFGSGRPESQELMQVPGPLHQLSGDGAMDCSSLSGDILQDSFVGGWLTPDIVFWLQAIYRDNHVHSGESGPSGRERAERAGYDLYVDAAREQQRNHALQLAVAHQRISAD